MQVSFEVLVLVATFLLIWVAFSVCMMMLLAWRYVDVIESGLAGCQYVRDNKNNFSSAGFLGRVLRTCLAANMLLMPGPFVRRGVADRIEMNKLPIRLKRVLILSWSALLVSVSLFFVFHGIVRFLGWSD